MLSQLFRRAHWGAGVLAVLALCLTACASSPAAAVQASRAAHGQPVSSKHYIIGPGDMLQVFVWQNPDLSVTVPVRPDGRISTPLVQDMVAAGKTPAQLAKDMEHALSAYLRAPTVNIIVKQPKSEMSEVKVIGQVAHPEAIPYHTGMRVLDVVLAAGGLTQYAAGNRAKIVRTVHGKTRDIRVELGRLLNNGDMSQNIPVKPGDVLVVPETLF